MSVEFRDRARAAQSSSEALDQRVHVVPLRAWLALGLALLVLASGAVWLLAGSVSLTAYGSGVIVNPPTNVAVSATVEGTVVGQGVSVGQRLEPGDVVATISEGTPAPDVRVTSPVRGVVVALGVGSGATVSVGDLLATIAPDAPTQIAYLYVPVASAEDVSPGMTVHLQPQAIDPTVDGYLIGTVASVSPLPVPRARLDYILADQPLAEQLAASGPLLEVQVALTKDSSTPTGFAWTQPPGARAAIVSGTPAAGTIIFDEVRPYRAFFSG